MADTLLRLMGETDIVDILGAEGTGCGERLPIPEGIEAEDRINLLGHWLDVGDGEALAKKPGYLAAMFAIAEEILQKQDAIGARVKGNFLLLTLLRERWPVGERAKYFKKTALVGAKHTYLAHLCPPASLDDLEDKAALGESETRMLREAMPHFRRHRKRFAPSSAVQKLIRQAF